MTPFQRDRPLGHRPLFRRRLLLSYQGQHHHVEHFRKSLCATRPIGLVALDLTHLRRLVTVTYLQELHHRSKPNLHSPTRMRILNKPNQCLL